MIHVRLKYGPLKVYRAACPGTEEIETQVVEAVGLAEYYERDAEQDGSLRDESNRNEFLEYEGK